ncbi:immunoglobulin superfamily member 10-like [Thunnus albacares]|uniref:immunoglobulin superfamily member 10-like n=1 Tax=Thunnus albacares TaxID=8236 RepID=UPI001CF67895|nr:immunoglobulin superfamily member 10-like [Thunnus albacares]
MQSRDVLQVTWQKLSPDGEEKNFVGYRNFEQGVSEDFLGKVEFKVAGLQNCSIVIRKVMDQDEGCYLCLFNTFPDGSLTGRTCLQLYELHEPILQIRESNSTEETVVSCSATGRPAPTVTLNVPQQDLYFSHNNTVSVTNTNGTVTVTTTAVLSGFHGNNTQVGCAAQLLSVPEIQVFKTIPAVKQSSADGFNEESGSDQSLTAVIQTQQTVMAAVGEDVHLGCQLMESRDVVQVTWQKLSPEGKEKNFVGYRNLEQGVSEDFLGKVEFKAAGLQDGSIVIREVVEQDEGCYLCLFNTFPEGSLTGRTCLQLYGLTAVIQTQQTVMAEVGEDVHLSCQLMQSRDVLQVTWQKPSPDGKKKNLVTYNEHFGQTVNDGFQGKVEFKDAGLQNCSIVIREVMEQDEGCYLCLFNTYPDGSLTGRTCLQLYELHEPILQIRESKSTEETVVSCSATGRPAPTVTLNVPQQDLYFSHNNTVSVTNTNGTVTITTAAVLSGFHGNGAQIGCAARLLSVPEIQVFKTIPADGFDDESGSNKSSTVIIVFVVLACGCVAAVIAVLLKRKYNNRDSEMNETPRATITDTYERVQTTEV